MRNKNIWLIAAGALIVAAAVLLAVCLSGRDGPEARTTQMTGEEAGVTVTTGLDAALYADHEQVTAWLNKCSRSDRDDVGVYALAWAAKDDDSMRCRWLILRTGVTAAAVPEVSVTVSNDRRCQVTVTYLPTEGDADKTDLILVEGVFDTDQAPDLDVVWETADLNGLLVTRTDEKF